jgi:chitooligosaccharide deacetylase
MGASGGTRRPTRRAPRALLLFLLAGTGCVPGVLLPEHDLLRDVHLRGPGTHPIVALTFDDGPNGRCTEAVLDALAESGAPATFFVLGANVATGLNDHALGRMVREGHAIGVHSYDHSVRRQFLHMLIEPDLRHALDAIAASLRRAGVADPPPVRYYRPPFGFLTVPAARTAAELGMVVVEWTVSERDWEPGREAGELTDAILARVRPGDVVVLHDGFATHQRSIASCTDRAVVPQVIRRLVPALRERGLRPAPLAEVLGLPG